LVYFEGKFLHHLKKVFYTNLTNNLNLKCRCHSGTNDFVLNLFCW